MSVEPNDVSMVTYQFTVDDETWHDWKQTVPRDKSLQQRIIELLEADTDGRVSATSAPTRASQAAADRLEQHQPADGAALEAAAPDGPAEGFGGVLEDAHEAFGDDPDARQQARVDSLRAALAAVREEPLSKSEIQAAAYPDAAIGQNERTWFRKTVKPFLKKVAAYSNADQKWHYSGLDMN